MLLLTRLSLVLGAVLFLLGAALQAQTKPDTRDLSGNERSPASQDGEAEQAAGDESGESSATGEMSAPAGEEMAAPDRAEADSEDETMGESAEAGDAESKGISETVTTSRHLDIQEGDIVVLPMEDVISYPKLAFMRRFLDAAEEAKAAAFILEMDTPGGELSACFKIIEELNDSPLNTFCFINNDAGSAGALITMSTDTIYMAPGSTIGAAAVVTGGGGDIGENMEDKIYSYYSAKLREIAENNGHNPDIAVAFMDKKKEVKIGGKMISESGTLLSLNSNEATEVIDGKPVLAVAQVDDVEALVEHAGLQGRLVKVETAPFEAIGYFLYTLAGVFLLLGLAGAYIEFQSPGFGVAGAVSIVSFALFFFGQYIVGLAGWESVALLMLGLILLAVELFVLPGTLITGLLGIVCLLLGAFTAMTDFMPPTEGGEGGGWLPVIANADRAIFNLTVGVLGSLILGFIVAAFLPKTPMFKGIALGDAISGTSTTGIHAAEEKEDRWLKVGMQGVASNNLRPSGKAQFGDIYADVISAGEWIGRGDEVRIVEIAGARVIVSQVSPTSDSAPSMEADEAAQAPTVATSVPPTSGEDDRLA